MRAFIGRGGRGPITSRDLCVASAEGAVFIDLDTVTPAEIVKTDSTARGCDIEPACAHTDGAFIDR